MIDSRMDLSLAGISLHLRFDDPVVYELCRAAGLSGLDGHPTATTPVAVLDVLSTDRASPPSGYDNASPLDGCDEYRGAFDPTSGRGFVALTSNYPAEALANCVRRLCSALILTNGGLVLHAACLAEDSNAWLFAGRSGAGKSTVCRLSPQFITINDDLTAVRKNNGQFQAWGMPRGELRIADCGLRNGPYAVKGLFMLVQDTVNRVVPLHGAQAVARALALPTDRLEPQAVAKALAILDDLANDVPVMELHFKKDPSFWVCIPPK